jgi:hypothetical protein
LQLSKPVASFGKQRWKEEGEMNSKEQKPEDVCSEELGIDVSDMITVVAVANTSFKLWNSGIDFISFASSCERCECMRSHRTHRRVLMTTLEFQFPTFQRCHLRILLK